MNPDQLDVDKPALASGATRDLEARDRRQGDQVIYTSDATVGKTTEFVDVEECQVGRSSSTDEKVTELARQARPSRSMTADRWTSSG